VSECGSWTVSQRHSAGDSVRVTDAPQRRTAIDRMNSEHGTLTCAALKRVAQPGSRRMTTSGGTVWSPWLSVHAVNDLSHSNEKDQFLSSRGTCETVDCSQDHQRDISSSLRPPGDWRRPRGHLCTTWLRGGE